MKFTRAALALAGATALVVSGMAAPALADTDVPIYGGTTTITTTAKALPKITGAGIVMWGSDGATSKYLTSMDKAQQQFGFDIVTPSSLMLEDDEATNAVGSVVGGKILHQGDVTFLNTNNGKMLDVGDFAVNFNKMKVFARSVNGDAVDPIAVFKLVVIDPPLYPELDDETTPTTAEVSGVKLLMTGKGAKALNSLLKTKVFAKDLKFGKAAALADLVAPVPPT